MVDIRDGRGFLGFVPLGRACVVFCSEDKSENGGLWPSVMPSRSPRRMESELPGVFGQTVASCHLLSSSLSPNPSPASRERGAAGERLEGDAMLRPLSASGREQPVSVWKAMCCSGPFCQWREAAGELLEGNAMVKAPSASGGRQPVSVWKAMRCSGPFSASGKGAAGCQSDSFRTRGRGAVCPNRHDGLQNRPGGWITRVTVSAGRQSDNV